MLSNLDTYLGSAPYQPAGISADAGIRCRVILISLILHECAHGYVAYRCGDRTAKMMGRLSLNPKAHLDLIGTLSMFLIGVGWAKPVPVNPRNFRHVRARRLSCVDCRHCDESLPVPDLHVPERRRRQNHVRLGNAGGILVELPPAPVQPVLPVHGWQGQCDSEHYQRHIRRKRAGGFRCAVAAVRPSASC